MEVFIAGNQTDDLGVTFHQLALSKGKSTGKGYVETNRFQCVNRIHTQVELFLQLAHVNRVGLTFVGVHAFALCLPELRGINQVVVILGDVCCTTFNFIVNHNIFKDTARIGKQVTQNMRVGA